jgi:hypothetical protein
MIIVHVCWDVSDDENQRHWEFESDIRTGYTQEEWDAMEDDEQLAILEDEVKDLMDERLSMAWYEDKDKRRDSDAG